MSEYLNAGEVVAAIAARVNNVRHEEACLLLAAWVQRQVEWQNEELRDALETKTALVAELGAVLREWSDPNDCGCDTHLCRGTCLAAKTRDTLERMGKAELQTEDVRDDCALLREVLDKCAKALWETAVTLHAGHTRTVPAGAVAANPDDEPFMRCPSPECKRVARLFGEKELRVVTQFDEGYRDMREDSQQLRIDELEGALREICKMGDGDYRMWEIANRVLWGGREHE